MGGGICVYPLSIRILEFLKKYGPASTRKIARELGKPYSAVYNTLCSLYVQGKVDCKLEIEPYPHGVGWLKVRYWWVKNGKGNKQ